MRRGAPTSVSEAGELINGTTRGWLTLTIGVCRSW
jgi:hypothetical protein